VSCHLRTPKLNQKKLKTTRQLQRDFNLNNQVVKIKKNQLMGGISSKL
jgi:hypothetical protein